MNMTYTQAAKGTEEKFNVPFDQLTFIAIFSKPINNKENELKEKCLKALEYFVSLTKK